MNQQILKTIEAKYGKKNPAKLKTGDTVRVYEKVKEKEKTRTQVFEGQVLAVKHGLGLNGTFTVRKIGAHSIGVEKIYPVHSPNIIKVERLKSAKVNRSKIYYLRDRSGKSAKLKREYNNRAVWEEKGAEEELERIKEETTEAAEEAAEEKAQEEEKVEIEEKKEEEKK